MPTIIVKAVEGHAGNIAPLIEDQLPTGVVSQQSKVVLPSSGSPIDIAIKEQVQEIYASVFFLAEQTLTTLEEYRSVCANQRPTEDLLAALAEILVDFEKDSEGGNLLAEGMQDLIISSTEAYEQLIWILMYGNQLVQRRQIEVDTPAGHQLYEPPPGPHPDHELLLQYLKGRFYPSLEPLEIAKNFEIIFSEIVNRNDAKGLQALDWSCFSKPEEILSLIRNVTLPRVNLPREAPRGHCHVNGICFQTPRVSFTAT